jgi:hypothetical protein
MIKTRRFQHGRFNYSIDYRQFQMEVIDEITGETTKQLMHREEVHYFELPFYFGKCVQFAPCEDVGAYYRQD